MRRPVLGLGTALAILSLVSVASAQEGAPSSSTSEASPRSITAALALAQESNRKVLVNVAGRELPIVGDVVNLDEVADHVALKTQNATLHVRVSLISVVQILDAQEMANVVYLGRSEAEWQRIFDSELHPLTRLGAAEALIHLAEGLPPRDRIAKYLESGSRLAQTGWGDQHLLLPLEMMRIRGTGLVAPKWQSLWNKETAEGWDHWAQLLSAKLRLMPMELVATEITQRIVAGSPHESSFAAYMFARPDFNATFFQNNDIVEPTIAALNQPTEDAERATLLTLLQAQLFDAAPEAQQETIRANLAALTTRWLSLSELDDVEAFLAAWERAAKAVKLDSAVSARMTLEWMLRRPSLGRRRFEFPLAFRYSDDYANRLQMEIGFLLDSWVATANQWLEQNRETASLKDQAIVLHTLEPVLRWRKQDQAWDVETTRRLLSEMLDRQTGGADASEDGWSTVLPDSPANLLALYVLAGGSIGDRERDESSSEAIDKKLGIFGRAISSGMARSEYMREVGKFRGIGNAAPYLTVKTALEADRLPEEVSLKKVIDDASVPSSPDELSRGPRPSMEPLLLLSILTDLAGQSEQQDERIAELLSSDGGSESLAGHIRQVCGSSLAARAIAIGRLQEMLERSESGMLDAQIVTIAPEVTTPEERNRVRSRDFVGEELP